MTQPSNPGVPEGQSAPQASPSQTPQRASAPVQPIQQAPAAQSAPTPITREQGPTAQGQAPAASQAQGHTAQEQPGTGAASAQGAHLPPRTSTTRAYAPPAQAGPSQQAPDPGPQAAPNPGPQAGQGVPDTQTQTGPQARRKPSVGRLIADITSQFSSIVRGEIQLAKVQAATMFARIRTGLVLMAAAAVFALFLLGWVLHTIEAALAMVLPVWAASLIIVGLLAVVAAVLALLGFRALRKAQESKPDPKAGITEAVHIVKNGLTK